MVAAVGKLRGESRGFCRGKGMKELDLAGKAVAWYCLSGPQTMGPGMFVLSEEVARADLDVSEEDWKFYFELVVQEMGWKWDEKLRLLWITDFFAWQPMQNKKHLLDTLHHLALLPETPWVWELAAAVPIELSASLQAAWTAWFFPAPAVATPEPETSTDEIEDFSQITPDAVPLVLRLWVNRRAPRFFVQAVKRLMLSEQKRQIDSAAESQAGNSERRAVEHSEHQASVNVTEVNLN